MPYWGRQNQCFGRSYGNIASYYQASSSECICDTMPPNIANYGTGLDNPGNCASAQYAVSPNSIRTLHAPIIRTSIIFDDHVMPRSCLTYRRDQAYITRTTYTFAGCYGAVRYNGGTGPAPPVETATDVESCFRYCGVDSMSAAFGYGDECICPYQGYSLVSNGA